MKKHWDEIYQDHGSDSLSWYQAVPDLALDWIDGLELDPDAAIVDVGAGTSALADGLLERGYRDLTLLDVSEAALAATRRRLGHRGEAVEWVCADLRGWAPRRRYVLWHDRAVFHFLTEPAARIHYRKLLRESLTDGGYALLATFAHDGPTRCSGLPVVRHSPSELIAAAGPGFSALRTARELHRTPAGSEQPFTWVLLRRDPRWS